MADYDNDFIAEMKKFAETKAGVKGLVDAGLVKLPRIFIQPPERLSKYPVSNDSTLSVPVIDLIGLENEDRKKEIVSKIRQAVEIWGVFQLINHGIPTDIIDSVLEGVKEFVEQPPEVKNADYNSKVFGFYSSATFKQSAAASWRDNFMYTCIDKKLEEKTLPEVCRRIVIRVASRCLPIPKVRLGSGHGG
ncbi:hypothetical protein ACFE04_031453 [Oxalis oulophora]